MNKSLAVLAGALLALLTAPAAGLGLVIDEATYPGANGDYNNLLDPPPAVVFDLEAGTNTFAGQFGTPGDAGDTIAILLDPLETLTAVRVAFATNANATNYVWVNQGTKLVLDSASSSNPTPILSLLLTGNPAGPVTFSSSPLALGADLYNVTLLTNLLSLSPNNARVGYEIAFDVTAIPEPTAYALLLAGLAVLALVRRRRATA
jgi:hypothetical protein